MTKEQFNKKWEDYIPNGSYGLAIPSRGVAGYLDLVLTENLSSELKIYQIKEKFGTIRVLIKGLDSVLLGEMEEDIYKILEEEENKENHEVYY